MHIKQHPASPALKNSTLLSLAANKPVLTSRRSHILRMEPWGDWLLKIWSRDSSCSCWHFIVWCKISDKAVVRWKEREEMEPLIARIKSITRQRRGPNEKAELWLQSGGAASVSSSDRRASICAVFFCQQDWEETKRIHFWLLFSKRLETMREEKLLCTVVLPINEKKKAASGSEIVTVR